MQLTEEEADFAHPQWLFGGATYAFLESGAIVCVRCRGAEERLFLLQPEGWEPADLGLPFTSFGYPVLVGARRDGRLRRRRARRARPRSSSTTSSAARPRSCAAPARSRSTRPTSRARGRSSSRPARARSPTASTTRRRTPSFEAPEGELPPLIVESHGGPTSHATPALEPRVPLLDQPRDRRRRRQLPRQQRLRPRVPQRAARRPGAWSTPRTASTRRCYLAEQGEADGERLAIRGGSAGGYATLCALTFHDAFAAGASYFGVADAEALARDTHKFESRYLDRLIGPYPERAELYRERSPINHVERLRCR